MKDNVTDSLSRNFSDKERLTYEDFIHEDEKGMDILSHVYEYNEGVQKLAFDKISRPWLEICWPDVADIGGSGSDSWFLPAFLNKKSFIHLFPSLLNFIYIAPKIREDKISTGCEMFLNCFVTQLDLNFVKQDWKKEFYFSLSEEMKKTVCLILESLVCVTWIMDYAKDALESYWHQWSEIS